MALLLGFTLVSFMSFLIFFYFSSLSFFFVFFIRVYHLLFVMLSECARETSDASKNWLENVLCLKCAVILLSKKYYIFARIGNSFTKQSQKNRLAKKNINLAVFFLFIFFVRLVVVIVHRALLISYNIGFGHISRGARTKNKLYTFLSQ